MRSRLFVRPNLRLFLLTATLLCLAVHVVNTGLSEPSKLITTLPVQARSSAKAELHYLLEQATLSPSSYAYTQLCLYYKQQGDYRKALFYLRKADALAEKEAFDE